MGHTGLPLALKHIEPSQSIHCVINDLTTWPVTHISRARKETQAVLRFLFLFSTFFWSPFLLTKTVSLDYFPATSWKWELMAVSLECVSYPATWNASIQTAVPYGAMVAQLWPSINGSFIGQSYALLTMASMPSQALVWCLCWSQQSLCRYFLFRCCSVCTAFMKSSSMTSMTSINELLIKCHPATTLKAIMIGAMVYHCVRICTASDFRRSCAFWPHFQ